MGIFTAELDGTGLEVVDLADDYELVGRPIRERDPFKQIEGMQRLAHAFVENPDTILQVLVDIAVEICGADSAGISIEKEDKTDEQFYQWIASAGRYSAFLNAVLPRYPSACGVCLERGTPQHFTVGKRFFDILGVEAAPVTDGILLPWEVEDTRGTIFVMAHGRTKAFDRNDCRMMKTLADYAAIGVRLQRQQHVILEQEKLASASSMANRLAHQINNPLQSITNVIFLAAQNGNNPEVRALAHDLAGDVERLSTLVKDLLALSR